MSGGHLLSNKGGRFKGSSNQLIVGDATTTTFNVALPSSNRIYTIPDVSADANYVLSEGSQTINGNKTFNNQVITSNFVIKNNTTPISTNTAILLGGISIIDSANSTLSLTLADSTVDGELKHLRLLSRRSHPTNVSLSKGSLKLDPKNYKRDLLFYNSEWRIIDDGPAFFVTTQQGSKNTGSDTGNSAFQGKSVAISADGDTIAIGGYGNDTNAGAVWVFKRSGTTWSQNVLINSTGTGTSPVVEFTAEDGTPKFGQSVALSSDGNTLAVGGDENNTNHGAVWVFTYNGSAWSQEVLIRDSTASASGSSSPVINFTGNTGTAKFGTSLSLAANGDTLAVGGNTDDSSAGTTWIFTRSVTTWTQQGTKLTGSSATGSAKQGSAVSLSADGNTLALGGTDDDTSIGATWIFTRSSTTWSQQGDKIIGTSYTGSAKQGSAISLSADGNVLAIGGPDDDSSEGAVWIFSREGIIWRQIGSKLVGSNGATSKQGTSVSLSADGSTLAIGGEDDSSSVGATWIFTYNKNNWSEEGSKLVGTGNTGASKQGSSVSLSADGNTLAVGGQGDDTSTGATWVFI